MKMKLCKYIKTIPLKTSRKIWWAAQINYNSAIQVINCDQIKCLPPSWIETLDFIQVSTCQPSKRVVQAEIPPPTRNPLLSIFMTQSNLKRAQADINVGNKNTELSSPSSSAWWFQKEERKVRQILQRNSSGAKAYPRPQSQLRRGTWVTIIVLINRNKSLKRKKSCISFLYLQA